MKSKTILSSFIIAVSAVCFFSVNSFGQEIKTPVRRSVTFTDSNYAYKLTDLDFQNTPSWNQEDGEPPLSVSRAVKAARENLPRFVQSAEAWKIRMVTMQSIGDDKWYYRIYFSCLGTACREIENRSFTAIVKMDGTIVEPKKVTIEK